MLPVSVVFLSIPSAEAAGSRKVCSLMLLSGLKEGNWCPQSDPVLLWEAYELLRAPWLAERLATRYWLILNVGTGESERQGLESTVHWGNYTEPRKDEA
jgi:hypothetical protein